MEGLINDIRYGARMLRKSPGFTAVAVFALALGIASTTAIFSVVDTVLLHPLPYQDPSRIVSLMQMSRSSGSPFALSPANYLDYVTRNRSFSAIAASRGFQGNLTGGDRPERIRYAVVSGEFFHLFGVSPLFGRGLFAQDETAGTSHVAVLSYGLWKSRYGSDRSLVGHNIVLNDESYTVVGVMPGGFAPDEYAQLWVPSPWDVPPYPLDPQRDPRGLRDTNYFEAWARLKPGVTLLQARSQMDGIARDLEKQYPDSNTDAGISVVPMLDALVGSVRPTLLLLVAAVVLVLLIGCANVANLLLARATGRAKEISIRSALGASRWRLVRQVLTESILLALLGGMLGVLLASWAVPALLTLSPAGLTDFTHVGVNLEVLGFSLAVSTLSGILFGAAPAFHTLRENVSGTLKEGERGTTGSGGRTRSALVVAEVGLSLLLLVAAGLILKSFVRLMNVDAGFNPDRMLVFNIGLPPSATVARQDAFYRETQDRIAAVPGVESAGAVSRLPLSDGNSNRSFKVPGSSLDYDADIRISTPAYLQTMGIPLLRGRGLSEQDFSSSVKVVVVNEALARTVFPGQDPVGKYLTDFGLERDKLQIVGVVGNIRDRDLGKDPRPEVYLPFGQAHWPSVFIAVRSKTDDPLALTSAVQEAVWGVNRDVPLANVRTMQDVLAASVVRRKFTALLLAVFAGLALLLAAVGLYGVMSYAVSQRTHEIGIRMALGADRTGVLQMVIKQGMTLVAIGLGLGFVVSAAATRLMAGLLFGVSATDPIVFGAVAALLSGVALGANFVPARRAAQVDPMVALRYQ